MIESIIHILPLLMFPALIILLFSGYPVGFTLGGIALAFGLIGTGLDVYNFKEFFIIISRIYGGLVESLILVTIPMFIFMGLILEKTNIASELLQALNSMTRNISGGLALSVTIMGTILAATTGIIGASVVMMTLMALPTLLKSNYDIPFATGTIAASGTLGILIPPSIMLVIMGDLLSISINDLFMAALFPGLMLSCFYLGYIFLKARKLTLKPTVEKDNTPFYQLFFHNFLPPILLIIFVLGSIFGGFATPTEASAVGAFGACIIALIKRKLPFTKLKEICESSATTTGMIFGIFIGATAFSYVFRSLGGDDLIFSFIQGSALGAWGILFALMLLTFILGFFFDWIEITLIVLPLFAPIIKAADFSGHLPQGDILPWFAILLAINLQTSFLTPPFGFALFYLKGAAPKHVKIEHIYKGVIPFIALQILGLILVMTFPQIALWLPTFLNQP